MAEGAEVQAARGHVGGEQHVGGAGLEVDERLLAHGLRQLAVQLKRMFGLEAARSQ